MKSRTLTYFTAMTLFAALAAPVRQAPQAQLRNKQQPRYRFVDLGTLAASTAPLISQAQSSTMLGQGWRNRHVRS